MFVPAMFQVVLSTNQSHYKVVYISTFEFVAWMRIVPSAVIGIWMTLLGACIVHEEVELEKRI